MVEFPGFFLFSPFPALGLCSLTGSIKRVCPQFGGVHKKGLSPIWLRKVIERLLADRDFMEELKAIALIELRREEPSRTVEEYLREVVSDINTAC